MSPGRKPELLIADVDGTLLDERKELTAATIAAVRRLKDAGIRFTMVSARPPKGMAMHFAPLAIDMPVAGFNGGLTVNPDLTVIDRLTLPEAVARRVLEIVRGNGLSPWVFVGNDWRLLDPHGPHTDTERHAIGYEPTVVADFEASLGQVSKIMGVSEDHAAVAAVEAALGETLGEAVNAVRSQAYYCDITHPGANKGAALDGFARRLGIPHSAIAAIGDQFTDAAMLRRAGFSIAMGNAPDGVKALADAVTGPNTADGFAQAVDKFLLDGR